MPDPLMGTSDAKEDLYSPSKNSRSAGKRPIINVDMQHQRQRVTRRPEAASWMMDDHSRRRREHDPGKDTAGVGTAHMQNWTGRTEVTECLNCSY